MLIQGRPSSGDREQDLRRQEKWAFDALLMSMNTLTDAPYRGGHNLNDKRMRVQKLKHEWWNTLRALDGLQ